MNWLSILGILAIVVALLSVFGFTPNIGAFGAAGLRPAIRTGVLRGNDVPRQDGGVKDGLASLVAFGDP